jgi:hypothetical protein
VEAGVTGVVRRVGAWWFAPVPRGRAALLRALLYAFVAVDVVFISAYGNARHGVLPAELYRPLLVGRLLPLPTPTPALVSVVKVLVIASVTAALLTRWHRLAGVAVFAGYLEWLVIYFSYGKVGHDRFAILVALAALPVAPRARWSDETPDEMAGWSLRCVQVAVVLTYFLAAYAKLRFGGIDWVNGATLMRAVVRRGTFLAAPLLDQPGLLRGAQYGIVAFEVASPLMLAPGYVGRTFVAAAALFQVVVYASIKLTFLPHVVCLLAFVPLEALAGRGKLLVGRRGAPGEHRIPRPAGAALVNRAPPGGDEDEP